MARSSGSGRAMVGRSLRYGYTGTSPRRCVRSCRSSRWLRGVRTAYAARDRPGTRGPEGGDVSAERSEDDSSSDDADGPTEVIIPNTDGPALVDLMRMSEDEWDAYTRGSAMRRAGYAGLRRNVAIALGNWLDASDTPDPEAVGELVAALSDEDPVVAAAAAWALGRAKGPHYG